MTPESETYHKLPGHRRGFLRGASVWIASDHLLSVNSFRVREEYKRFQFGDVQAILVARCPRFHISTRSLLIAAVWLGAYGLGRQFLPAAYSTALWLIAASLVAAWIYISYAQSCRCRILTAVSRDDLPSIYRTWTARRFLAEVSPRITQVQGSLVGNWFEAVDSCVIGPPSQATAIAATGSPTPGTGVRRPASFFSILFVATLFVSAAAMLLTLHSSLTLLTWLGIGLLFIEVAAIVGVFVQHHRRQVRSGMQRLAIVTIAKIGVAYYISVVVMSALSAGAPRLDRSAMLLAPSMMLLRQIDAWADLALGLVGAVLLLSTEYAE